MEFQSLVDTPKQDSKLKSKTQTMSTDDENDDNISYSSEKPKHHTTSHKVALKQKRLEECSSWKHKRADEEEDEQSSENEETIRKQPPKKKPKHTHPNPSVLVKKLRPDVSIPRKSTSGAAGFDLASPSPVTIRPGEMGIIKTKVALQIPHGYYGQIAMRSGLARDQCLMVLGGIIDSDFTGEIVVMVLNGSSRQRVTIEKHECFAQIIISKIHDAAEMVVSKDIAHTKRGTKGFGSTGLWHGDKITISD